MRAAKWLGVAFAALFALLAALVLIVTLVVDPNRFKGRIEHWVGEASGQAFAIRGDLKIAWYPWLALKMGEARLGDAPLLQWRAASFGARLLPLIRGQLIVDRVRFEGLQVHLEKDANGHGNWQGLLAANRGAAPGGASPQLAGVEVRNGTLEYVDAETGSRLSLLEWQLDLGAWRQGAPFSLTSRFSLRQSDPAGPLVPVTVDFPSVAWRRDPPILTIPQMRLSVANATVEGALALQSAEPLRAQGSLTLKSESLRELLDHLAIGIPRPRDVSTFGKLSLAAQWACSEGALAVKPLELNLDETHFTGEVVRPSGDNPVLRFELRGDRIALDRYAQIEDTSSEPFELPTDALRSLRVAGVLSFDEAQMAGARISNARLRFETPAAAGRSNAEPKTAP